MRLSKSNLVSIDLSTAKYQLGFKPGFFRCDCNVATYLKLPLACNSIPWLLDLKFRIEENMHNDDVPSRVFQITLRGLGRIPLLNGGKKKILLGRSFYWVVGIWGMSSTILTFFKAKKQHSVNIEHQLKSKLGIAWPMCKKSMKLVRRTSLHYLSRENPV